jgi:hypothetical protein
VRGDLSYGAVDPHFRVVDEALHWANDRHTRLAQNLNLPRGCLVPAASHDEDRTCAAHGLQVRMRVLSQRE